ncbi:MAG: FdtA/QdtA family cupin domain-containing protein [Candidatus Omnitrophica bacterium]|nr:FdtA/QdtA family cupin domain-containing protein [Candidatus Omnitrophota bacterium]
MMQEIQSNFKYIKWIDLPSINDSRGFLTAIESERDIPITIKRVFYMHHIVSPRGGHAHTETDQVVIASSGSFKMELCDGRESRVFEMNDAKRGLFIPKMIFINIFDFSADAVCMVLADTHYNISKSIRSWEEYLNVVKKNLT